MSSLSFEAFNLLAQQAHMPRICLAIEDLRRFECCRIGACRKKIFDNKRIAEIVGNPERSEAELALLMQIDSVLDEKLSRFDVPQTQTQ
ncbi:hypothetical protein OMD46_20485 [Pseudomonas sp. MDMC_285]|nr:hypothetical protein [Pseudomonas sp. MDMC_285]